MTAPTMDERRAVARRLRALIGGRINWTGLQCAVFGGTALRSDTVARLADLIDHGEGMDEDGRAAPDGYTTDAREVVDSLSSRLMPEGMSWPRFDDLEPVRIGDDFMDMHGRVHTVASVRLKGCGEFSLVGTDRWGQGFPAGSRVGRPGAAPKVLDADGVEIRVGDTVWDEHGDELVVLAVYGQDVHCRYAEYEDQICDNGTWEPSQLTHRAPVLAADGMPLREGETVYKLDDDRPYTLKRFDGDHVYINAGGSSLDIWTFPNKLTHEQPDSWERLEDDATQHPWYYCKQHGVDTDAASPDADLAEVVTPFARDLVRRARALAERGQ